MVNSGTWTLNTTIREAALSGGFGQVFTQFPHFEGHFFDAELAGGKVDHVLDVLNDQESPEYKLILETYRKVLAREAAVMSTTVEAFDACKVRYVDRKLLAADPHWV